MLRTRRLVTTCVGVVCLIGLAQSQRRATADTTTAPAKAEDLAITIAGPGPEDPRIVDLNVVDPRIQVVIRNASNHKIKLWNENNSCGYDNVTLEVNLVDGRVLSEPIVIGRHIDAWFSNFISSLELAPGDCIVRDIRFARTKPRTLGEEWFYWGLPITLDRVHAPHVLGMRAVFNSKPTTYTGGTTRFADVWIGTSASARHDYKIDTFSAPVEMPP